MWLCAAKFLSSVFNTTYVENVVLFFSFSLNGGLPTPLIFDLDVCQRVVMALNSCICPCVHVCMCQWVCLPVCYCRVLGCPSSIGLALYSIPQGGPGLCASGECQGEKRQCTVTNTADAEADSGGLIRQASKIVRFILLNFKSCLVLFLEL